jgi:DNA-binding protein HU-beta
MTKNDFINLFAQEMEIPASQAEKSFNAVIKGLTNLLTQGDELTLPGFGKFSVVHKAARTGRNPITGQAIDIKAKAVPQFKPGDALKLNVANSVKANPKQAK